MKKLLMTGAAIMALSTAAGASTFSIVGGTPGQIPGGGSYNNVLDLVFGMPAAAGFYGASVNLDSAALITVDFIGFEAGFENQFSFGGNGFDTEDFAPFNSQYAACATCSIDSYTTFATAGLLNFSFSVDAGAASVTNLSNQTATGIDPNFFVSYGQGGADTIYLWLDDGASGPDDNHDDMVVRLTVESSPPGPTPVPLPAAGLMLMGALGGLGLMKRRK